PCESSATATRLRLSLASVYSWPAARQGEGCRERDGRMHGKRLQARPGLGNALAARRAGVEHSSASRRPGLAAERSELFAAFSAGDLGALLVRHVVTTLVSDLFRRYTRRSPC